MNPEIVTENQSVEDNLKDFKAKMVKMFKLAQKANESQIIGEQQLIDLTKSVKYISEQFDEYEKDKKEKEEIIKNLEGQVNNLTETVAKLVKQADNQEQHSRSNCLLVHPLPETTLENIDDLVITMFKNEMDIEMFLDDIDRSHRIGKQKYEQELRMSKLKEAKDEFGFRSVWSTDGRILYKKEASDQTRVYYKDFVTFELVLRYGKRKYF